MERSTGVINLVSLTQGVKIIPLPRVLVTCHLQRIYHTTNTVERADSGLKSIQFGVDKAHIKGRVVDHQLCTTHKFDKLLCDLTKDRFAGQKFLSYTVHFQRASIDIPFGLDVLMVVAAGDAPVDELNATNLDNAMTLIDFESRGFRVEHDLTPIHRWLSLHPCQG